MKNITQATSTNLYKSEANGKTNKGALEYNQIYAGFMCSCLQDKGSNIQNCVSCNKAHTCFALRNYYFQINKQDITSLVTALENTLNIYLGFSDDIKYSAFFRPFKEN